MYRYHCLWKLPHLFSFCCVRILYLILSQCRVCTVSFPQFPRRHYYFSSVYLSIISDWEIIILVILSAFIIHTEESYNSKKITHIPGRRSLVYRPHVSKQHPPSFIVFFQLRLDLISCIWYSVSIRFLYLKDLDLILSFILPSDWLTDVWIFQRRIFLSGSVFVRWLFLKLVIIHWRLITCHVTVIHVSDNYHFETQQDFTRAHALSS